MDYSPFYFKKVYNKKKKKKDELNQASPYLKYYSSNTNSLEADGVPLNKENENLGHERAYEENAAQETEFVKKSQSFEEYEKAVNDDRKKSQTENFKNANDSEEEKIGAKKTRKKLWDRAGVFAALSIVICFLIVIFASEFFSGGVIVEEMKAAINPSKGESYYFLTEGPFSSELRATTNAALISEKGGAGFVYLADEQYYVVIATYLDKKTADSVAKKNEGLKVFEIKTEKPDFTFLSAKDKKFSEGARSRAEEIVAELYNLSVELDKAKATRPDALDKISSIRNELLQLLDDIAGSGMQDSVKKYLSQIIYPLFGGLDAILSINYGNNLAGAIRNVVASGAYALSVSKL